MERLKAVGVGRPILRYALPLFGSQILALAGSLTALALLGKLGVDTLGAVAAPLVLLNLAAAAFAGFSSGAMILVSRARALERGSVNRLVAQALTFALAFGIAIGALGAALAPAILHAANVPGVLMRLAVPYSELLALSLPATFVYAMYVALLEGLGDSKASFAMLAAYTAIYLAGLAALRIGPLGIPVAGLAATIIVTAAAAIVLYARRPEFRFDVAPSAAIPDLKTLRVMLRLDLPVNAQFLAVAFADLAIVSIANGFGARGGAAFAVLAQLLAVLAAPATIFATAVCASERSLRPALLAYTFLGGAMTVAAYFFATPLLQIFISDAQTLHFARTGTYTIAWSLFALGIANVVSAESDAVGRSLWPALAAIAGVWVVLVPCALFFADRWGIDGIWYAYALAYGSIAVAQIGIAPILLRRPRRVREQVPAAPERTI